MAILKIVPGERYTLAGMIDYIGNTATHDDDILDENGVYVSNANHLMDMLLIKKLYNKTGGLQYKQIILSLEEAESIEKNWAGFIAVSEEAARAIAYITGCQVAYAVHSNTDNLHTHFVVNSVRFSDGYKIQLNRNTTILMKSVISQILEQYAFNPVC